MSYCVQADIERLLSVNGVTAFADHDQDGIAETGVVADVIEAAQGEIDLFCRGRYSEDGLESSALVTRWATVLSAAYLCELRGNPIPDSIQRAANRILEVLLPQIQNGVLNLPGLAFGNDLRPAMSNLTIDRRFARSKLRVTKVNSTNQVREMATNYADEPIPNG